jgi:hypothetical protein
MTRLVSDLLLRVAVAAFGKDLKGEAGLRHGLDQPDPLHAISTFTA